MKKLSMVILIGAFCSSLAIAADKTPAPPAAGDATPVGKPTEKGAGDTYLANEFWAKNAKDGFLSKEDALKFKGADGKSVDMQKLDVDNDGRISQREWAAYHESAGAAGIGAGANSKTDK